MGTSFFQILFHTITNCEKVGSRIAYRALPYAGWVVPVGVLPCHFPSDQLNSIRHDFKQTIKYLNSPSVFKLR